MTDLIYCVEDDGAIRELVVYTLQNSGLPAQGFADGKALFAALSEQQPQLILLDVMMPGEDGIAVLRRLRANAETRHLPVILLTAKDTEYDKVIGLDAGADDYIAKPFGMMELLARVRALLRRTQQQAENPQETERPLVLGEITLDEQAHTVFAGEESVSLTLKEFRLLALLMKNSGKVLTRDVLLETIWGYGSETETRTVDVHIRTLRQKLGACGERIETVRGVGYRMGERV